MECVGRCRLTHCHKPLIGQHGFKHGAATVTAWLHHFVCVNLNQKTLFFKFSDNGLAGIKTIHALKLRWRLIADFRIKREDHDQGQTMAHRAGIIVKVMGARDFDAAGTKSLVHKAIGNNWNLAVA